MTYRSLKQYFDHRIITDLLAPGTKDYVILKGSEDSLIVRIPIVAWVLIEYYSEEKKKNGTVITAAFIDPFLVTDDKGNVVILTTLTTLDMFLQHHPDKTFLRFEKPNTPHAHTDRSESAVPTEELTISAEGNVGIGSLPIYDEEPTDSTDTE